MLKKSWVKKEIIEIEELIKKIKRRPIVADMAKFVTPLSFTKFI